MAWTAFKVGALSYGGGFVIIPLMQGDAVDRHGWMTETEFLNAVAFGQLTPGPGHPHGRARRLGGVRASAARCSPLRSRSRRRSWRSCSAAAASPACATTLDARAFLDGAGPAAVGAILGAAVPLAQGIEDWWQVAVLAGAALVLALGRGPLWALGGGALIGLIVGVA